MAVLPVSPDQVAVVRWAQVLERLKARLASEQAVETWFRPIVPREIGTELAELEAPNGFFVDWIHEHHLTALRLALTDVLGRCPEVRFILDHIGKPAIREGRLDPWRADIERLAALPNVWCKLSGVVTEADHAAWTREQLRPYIRHAAERFGFERLLFGSDWPVSTLTHSYGEWVDIVAWALGDCSEDERRKLFRDNAIAFYRLDAAGR